MRCVIRGKQPVPLIVPLIAEGKGRDDASLMRPGLIMWGRRQSYISGRIDKVIFGGFKPCSVGL